MRRPAHRWLPCLLGLILSTPHLSHAGASTPSAPTLQPLAESEMRSVVGAGSDLAGALGGLPARPSNHADERALQALEEALKGHERREVNDQGYRAMQTATAALAPVTAVSFVNVATLPLALVGLPVLGLLSLAQFAPQAPRAPEALPQYTNP